MSFDFACDGVVMCPLEFKSTWKTATPYNGKIGYFGSEYQFLILEGWGWGGGADTCHWARQRLQRLFTCDEYLCEILKSLRSLCTRLLFDNLHCVQIRINNLFVLIK